MYKTNTWLIRVFAVNAEVQKLSRIKGWQMLQQAHKRGF